jgi:hypothetical protein
MRRAATVGVVMLIVAACGSEHLPREVGDAAAPADAAPDVVIDVAVLEEASIPDASDEDVAMADAAVDAEASTPPLDDAGDCNVRVDSPAILASPHVAAGTAVTYNSNPPSSGPHYPVWANFQEFSSVVPDGNLVHSLEHGGVALYYDCNLAEPACAKVLDDLRAVRNAMATDPSCDSSIRVRVIIAPRPANDTVVAAAAWGQIYRADCVNIDSLKAWATAHYAKGPEDLCAAGQVAF